LPIAFDAAPAIHGCSFDDSRTGSFGHHVSLNRLWRFYNFLLAAIPIT